MSHINPVHATPSYISKIHFSIIHSDKKTGDQTARYT
jgi:hypothetical protein